MLWHKSITAAFLTAFCCTSTLMANPSTTETPVSWSHGDPELQWGPCPEFMPEGCAIAVLHGDPSKKNADIFFKVPAGAVVPRHTHTSAERMVLVSGALRVTYDGQERVDMKAGIYAYGPPELPHKAVCTGAEACVLAIAFEQPIDAFPQPPGGS